MSGIGLPNSRREQWILWQSNCCANPQPQVFSCELVQGTIEDSWPLFEAGGMRNHCGNQPICRHDGFSKLHQWMLGTLGTETSGMRQRLEIMDAPNGMVSHWFAHNCVVCRAVTDSRQQSARTSARTMNKVIKHSLSDPLTLWTGRKFTRRSLKIRATAWRGASPNLLFDRMGLVPSLLCPMILTFHTQYL